MDNYELSNSLRYKKLPIKKATKVYFQKVRNSVNITQSELQKVSDLICKDLGLNSLPIIFSGKQLKSRRSVTKGHIKISNRIVGGGRIALHIKIYRYTAVRQQQISNKVALDILLHELTHYTDYFIFNLNKSIHSAGFYQRISQLRDKLLS